MKYVYEFDNPFSIKANKNGKTIKMVDGLEVSITEVVIEVIDGNYKLILNYEGDIDEFNKINQNK